MLCSFARNGYAIALDPVTAEAAVVHTALEWSVRARKSRQSLKHLLEVVGCQAAGRLQEALGPRRAFMREQCEVRPIVTAANDTALGYDDVFQ